MAYKHILYEENKKDFIGILTLNEPEKRNALGREAEEEITHVVQDAAKARGLEGDDPQGCRGYFLRRPQPAGDPEPAGKCHQKAFPDLLQHDVRPSHRTRSALLPRSKGIAMAGGCHLAAGCDLITAGKEKAKFGMTGLIYSYNCSTPTIAVSRAVPQKKCFEMLMTANLYTAEEAAGFQPSEQGIPG